MSRGGCFCPGEKMLDRENAVLAKENHSDKIVLVFVRCCPGWNHRKDDPDGWLMFRYAKKVARPV
jgi:hypothetical protein